MRRKSKRKIIVIIAGILLIFSGLLTAVYPSITAYISSKESNEMLKVLDEQIAENIRKNKDNRDTGDKTQAKTKHVLTQSDLYKGASDEVKQLLKGQKLIGIISIKKLKIRFPICDGSERSNIRASIGHLTESSDIGAVNGNCVLAGHRGGVYGEFFKYINKLKKGDTIEVTTLDGNVYTYSEYEQIVVEPTNKKEALKKVPGQTTLTLLSCNDHGTRRLLVRCKLEKVSSLY